MIDFGDTKVVDVGNVRRLPKKFGRLPKMALPCKLQRVSPLKGSSTFSGLTNTFTLTVILFIFCKVALRIK